MAEMCCVWKILMKKCMVMVTNIQNCLPNPNGLTTEILNLHLWCGDPSNEI